MVAILCFTVMVSILLLAEGHLGNADKQAIKHKFREKAHLLGRASIRPGRRAQGHEQHSVVFAPRQRSLAELEEMLMRVSDPLSAEYGRHWSREAVGRWSRNETAVQGLLAYLGDLQTQGLATIEQRSLFDEYITVRGPISLWESVFATSFREYAHKDWDEQKILRAAEYSLPLEIDDHVAAVFNVVHFPIPTGSKAPSTIVKQKAQGKRSLQGSNNPTKEITPALLNAYYNITFNSGNNRTSQSVYATIQQTLSPSDLTFFQQQYNLPVQGIAANYGGHVRDDACTAANGGVSSCVEANLDVQYIMAVAQDVPTIYHYFYTASDQWLNFILETASLPSLPDVISISYGSYELLFTQSYVNSFSTEVMKLGIQGVSVLAADGDDGASGYAVKTGELACDYYAMFPACCPYVTSIGGTQGPELNQKEIVCQSDKGSAVTTGGGFSAFYSRPSWQAGAVSGYFSKVAGTAKAPVAGYPANTRGFPDVSMVAVNYHVIADKTVYFVSGTSAACPAVAGMVALVNSARRVSRNNTMGWLNPFLYKYYKEFTNDITVGWNNCTSDSSKCCAHGYSAAEGWDPVTGLGSINFGKFLAVAMSNTSMPNYVSPSRNPTISPTRRPTFTPSARPSTTKPSARPTQSPTFSPTKSPTNTPTRTPTTPSPTYNSSSIPTVNPTIRPTANPTQTPTCRPTQTPTLSPTALPTYPLTAVPSVTPTFAPSPKPTFMPTPLPTSESYFISYLYYHISNLTAEAVSTNLDTAAAEVSSISCTALELDSSHCSADLQRVVFLDTPTAHRRLNMRQVQTQSIEYSINATVTVIVPMSVVRQNFTTGPLFYQKLLTSWHQATTSNDAGEVIISLTIIDSLRNIDPAIFADATVAPLGFSSIGEVSSFAPTYSPTFKPTVSPTKAFNSIDTSPPGHSAAWSTARWLQRMWTEHNDAFILLIVTSAAVLVLLIVGSILMYCKNTNKIRPQEKVLSKQRKSTVLPPRKTAPERVFVIDPNVGQPQNVKLRS